MKYLRALLALLLGNALTFPAVADEPNPNLQTLLTRFENYTGSKLVFQRDDLPAGRYHDVLKPLANQRKPEAASICLEEAKMYPPKYFQRIGLKAIGVFAACASKTTTDSSRPYDKGLGGYRYFGVYNGDDAVAASFYSDGQLRLTFHHEVFHHVDAVVAGEHASWQLSGDDAFYQAAISGHRPYPSPQINGNDLQALRDKCIGYTLKDTVSAYAAKNSREDQAETARHIMSVLPNSLVQTIDKPHLAGSQRIIHVLKEYELAVADGPGFDWFVDVALKRADRNLPLKDAQKLIAKLKTHLNNKKIDANRARQTLKAVAGLAPSVSKDQAAQLKQLAGRLSTAMILHRLRPDRRQTKFNIWGNEDSQGINRTLRHDIATFTRDAERLHRIYHFDGEISANQSHKLSAVQFQNLRIIARYFSFIESNYSVTKGTRQVFDDAKDRILKSLPTKHKELASALARLSLDDLGRRLPVDGQMQL